MLQLITYNNFMEHRKLDEEIAVTVFGWEPVLVMTRIGACEVLAPEHLTPWLKVHFFDEEMPRLEYVPFYSSDLYTAWMLCAEVGMEIDKTADSADLAQAALDFWKSKNNSK